MRRTLALAAVGIALGAAAPVLGRAATFAATTVEHVARTSDAVVRGTVASAVARPTRDGRIVTEVEIAVASAWKGAPGRMIRVVVPGGTLPDVAMHVDGAPRFTPGEEVVAFVNRRGPAWHVNGRALGKFRVSGDEALPSVDGHALLPRPLPPGEREVGPMPLAELERRVRAAR
jgi:hypothetical protein